MKQKKRTGKMSRVFCALNLMRGAVVLGFATSIAFVTQAAPTEVPFLARTYADAQKTPDKSVVSATVTMTSLSGPAPKVIVAQGALKMEGDLLGARLPMTFDSAGTLPKGAHSLMFNVSKTGRIGLQWLLNDKPRDGVSMQSFDTDAKDDTLSKKITWNGAPRLVTVVFKRNLQLGVLRPDVKIGDAGNTKKAEEKEEKKKSPLIIGKVLLPSKPKGRNVQISLRLVVTNSDDGISGPFSADKTVEMSGQISLGGYTALNFNKTSGHAGEEFKASRDVAVTYADPDAKFFKVEGKVWDWDKASATDTMWLANVRIDLLEIMNSNKEFLIKGDRNSENADLYIRVSDKGEFK